MGESWVPADGYSRKPSGIRVPPLALDAESVRKSRRAISRTISSTVPPNVSLGSSPAAVSLTERPAGGALLDSRLNSPSRRRAGAYLFSLAVLTAVYFVSGKLGLALAFVNESASAVWPPAGIAVGALLAFGRHLWPAVAVGAFLVNITTSGLLFPSLMIAAGNTLESLVGAWCITAWTGGAAAFDRTRGVFRFSVLACSIVPAIAATVGTAALLLAGLTEREEAASVWVTWWLGDAVGIMMFTPLLVLWSTQRSRAVISRRPREAALVYAAVVVVAWIVFGNSPAGVRNYPLQFMAAPLLLWPAFRLGARETMTATTLLGLLAVVGTLRGYGPFAWTSPNESLLLLQAFVGTFALLMLGVAAEVSTRVGIEAEMRALNDTLERRVNTRTDELSRLHARLAEAQSVAQVGSWEWDVRADAVWWSDELCRIYGVPVGTSMTYDQFLQMVHTEDRALVENAVRTALADRRPFSFDHRIVRPDGAERILHAHGHVTVGASGNVGRLVGTAHDITERRKAEDERAQLLQEQAARREAEAANRAKDEFLAMLSHELRTPLNAALGWAQMLRGGQVESTATRDRAVEAIWRNLRSQARLVSDMLDTSHILLGTLRLDRTPVDLAAVAQEAADMIQESAAARGVRLALELPPTPAWVHGDGGRLQQIVCNLLSNAAKFSKEGGVIEVTVRREQRRVILVVEDDGPGIAPEFLPHIFDRFRQADSSVTRQHGGLGLGLAIARHLVEAHGGTITAANRLQGGAVLTVALPASDSAAV